MKTIKFMLDGNNVRIITLNEDTVTDKLVPAVYTLCFCKFTGYYLRQNSARFNVPNKVYGLTERRVNKVINTYLERSSSTGILLSGDKGSGKTMTSSLIANQMIDMDLPVILIEEAYSGSGFNEFLNNIGECCLFFDEFGKIYSKRNDTDDESQTDLLSLFDGTGSQKRLIMLTENNTYDINEFMLERPGRVYYHFKHNKIDQELITEYCETKKMPKGVINEVLMRCETSWSFSFDTLQAIVEEWERYGGTIKDIAADLNIEQPITRDQQMEIKSVVDIKTETSFLIEPKDKITDYPIDETSYVRWKAPEHLKNEKSNKPILLTEGTNSSDKGELVASATYVGVKDIISRTGNKVVFECMETDVIITAEILPVRATYNRNAF